MSTESPAPLVSSVQSHRSPVRLADLPHEPGSGLGRKHGTSSNEPFDRWFRYPAGFASDYVAILLENLDIEPGSLVVDPFAGSAVTGTAARRSGLGFFGIEAHPLIAELGALKLRRPPESSDNFVRIAKDLARAASQQARSPDELVTEPDLVRRCFSDRVLGQLAALRELIRHGHADPWSMHAKWALLGTLREVASARVGWPYQRPGSESRPRYNDPLARFSQRASWIAEDLQAPGQGRPGSLRSRVLQGDSRNPDSWKPVEEGTALGCVSSPPYLNNFDYADATRLELYFWGDVTSWSEMCKVVRSKMITATTQQSSVTAARSAYQQIQQFGPVAEKISDLTERLKDQRKSRTRGKEYDRVVPDYFLAISEVLANLATSLATGAPVVWLVGDSAPYGVYIDTPALVGQLAENLGFTLEKDTTLRRRGQRWQTNGTRHNTELSERLLLLRR